MEESIFGFFYDEEKNVFYDEMGFIVWNIFDWITPNDLYLFRFYKADTHIKHRSLENTICELYYPEECM